MPTNQHNNTQKTAFDRLKSTQEKLTKKIKLVLKTATAEETLQLWMLMKRQELKKTTPSLSEQQIESVIKSLILELGYDIIATSTTPLTAISQESEAQIHKSGVDGLDEDNDGDFNDDDLEDNKDDLSEAFEEKIPSRKQRIPALRKVANLRSFNSNGKHS